MFKRLTVLAAAALALAAVVPIHAEILEQVLVKVNGDIVTKSEFEQRQVTELRSKPNLANVSPTSPELQKAIAEITPDLILDMVDQLLLVQRGRELGYTLTDDQYKNVLDSIKKQNKIDTDEQFQQALKESGMSATDLRKEIEKNALVQRVQQTDVMEKISVTEEETRTYYDAHREEFTTPAEITLREIFIQVPQDERGVNVAADDAAKEKADSIRNRALAGEPFARLAVEASASPSKSNGGLVGPIKEQELAPALQEIIDKMKPGDISEVMRVPRGYQILRLESRSATKIRTYDEARDDISRKVAQNKSQGELMKYLERLRGEATIVWRNDELKKAYDLALQKREKELAGQQGA
ncbi:MAG TPA: peptidyl-prolyl cis-trans isomerase [Vicinamibacterales bacterium]|jgi:parvulin-like peptidyl-prolyl isomerase|nr:peptidyl-prolyl cis-trans isomerase [Vicinamibacterales bacterium]